MPAAPRAGASIAPLGSGRNDASLVLVTTLLANPRASGAVSSPAAQGAASELATPLIVSAILTSGNAAPDAVLAAALHLALNGSMGAADRVLQAGWRLANDSWSALTNTVSAVSQAVRSLVGDDAQVLGTAARDFGDNLLYTSRGIGEALAAAARSVLDQRLRAAPNGPARLAPVEEQPDPSVPDELMLEPAMETTEPQETAALVALFIAASLTDVRRPRRGPDRRRFSLKSSV